MFMDATAINSFRAVDRFLVEPGAGSASLVHDFGHDKARLLLRRVAGEANAWLFEGWEWIQLGLGLALLVVLVLGTKPPRILILFCLLMLAIVLVSHVALTPNIASLARVIDFLPNSPAPPERRTFGIYHGISSSLELLKLALLFAAAGVLLVRRRTDANTFARKRRVREEVVSPRNSR